MIIKPAARTDAAALAKLHSSSITTGFLSMLGDTFLTRLYEGIVLLPGNQVLIAQSDDGNVCGFIAGTVATRQLYFKVLILFWYRLVPVLLRFLLNRNTIVRIVETVLYGFRNVDGKASVRINAELLSIAVDSSRRGEHVGRRLVERLEAFFRDQQVEEYKVVTFAPDVRSNSFYLACGFGLKRTFKHHENQMNEYVKRLH